MMTEQIAYTQFRRPPDHRKLAGLKVITDQPPNPEIANNWTNSPFSFYCGFFTVAREMLQYIKYNERGSDF